MKKIVSLLILTLIVSTFQTAAFAETVYETVAAEPVVSYDPSAFTRVEAPSSLGTSLHLESDGRTIVDAVQQVNLKPSTEYLIVYDITKNTNQKAYFVALRAKGFLNSTNDIVFPKGITGEHRVLFTTDSRIRNPYIWSYAYNGDRNVADEMMEFTYDVYEASLFDNPLSDPLTIQVAVEEPVVEEPVVEEPVVEEPVVEEPVVEEPVVEEPVVEEPISETSLKPVVSFDPNAYTSVELPSYVTDVMHLESNGTSIIDMKYEVSLQPNTEYLLVYDLNANTYDAGYFVAVRAKGFTQGSDILFPKTTTGEHRVLFTTAAEITNPYIWSYAYNNSGLTDMSIEGTFDIYLASDLADPMNDPLVVEEPINEEPINEEPINEEPINEEPTTDPVVQPFVSFDPNAFTTVETPSYVTDVMHLKSNGASIIDMKYEVSLQPNTEYLLVYDLNSNTYEAGYFVAVRAKGFTQGSDILFPKTTVGEHRVLFTTAAEITNPYIWSYAYNNSGLTDMSIEGTFDIYLASDFADPMNDSLNKVVEEPVVEEPINEEPVVEEPIVEEPVVEEPIVEEPVVEPVTGVRTSELGMVPNNSGSASKNATLFTQALNEYGRVIIDDVYYMGSSSVDLTQKNIEIYGENNAELKYNYSYTYVVFDANTIENFYMKGVTVTNINSSGKLLFIYSKSKNKTYVESVVFDDNTWNGTVSAYRLLGDTTLNPDYNNFGIGNFEFKNNEVYGSKTSFLMFKDIPFETVKINNNNVRNFGGIFIDATVTNGITYGSKLRNHRNYIEVTSNSVINDDSWWNPSGSVYHGFIIAENKETLYDNNHVEGLKANEKVALYDAYLSSDKVTYTNNLWKNNIAFYADKVTNTLLKAKTGYNATRLYQNNVFIVEESFAERVGGNKEYLYVGFIDINAKLDSYQIIGNTFDIYDLRFQISSREVEEYVFRDNIMNAKYASGRMFITKLVDGYQSRIEFVNNMINIQQNTYRAVTGSDFNNYFGLIQTVDSRTTSSSPGMDLIFSDNVITGPINYAFQNPYLENVSMSNNDITVVESLYVKFSYGGNQPELEKYPVSYK